MDYPVPIDHFVGASSYELRHIISMPMAKTYPLCRA
jgi:hypothetical protein